MRYVQIFLLLLLSITQMGCSLTRQYTGTPIPPKDPSNQFGDIAIIPAQYAPDANFDTFAKGRLSGTTKGALGGAAFGAAFGAEVGSEMREYALLFMPLLAIGGAVIGGTVGGVAGNTNAVPETTARQIEAAMTSVVCGIRIQETMVRQMAISGNAMTDLRFGRIEGIGPKSHEDKVNYALLNAKGINTVFEVAVTGVGFEGGRGSDPEIFFFMTVSTRLIRTQDGTELYTGEYKYKSKPRKFTAWAYNNATPLRDEFALCYKYLAEQIIDETFILFDVPVSYLSSYESCSVKPVYPEVKFGFLQKDMAYIKIGSIFPTIRWEAFPGEREKEIIDRINSVTYDLKIWKVEGDHPGRLAYEKRGIPDPYHTIESRLNSSSKYFWTVRANFILDGHKRATKWASSRRPLNPCRRNDIPNANYFRFTTEQ
jgi:hypothetical protein